MRKAFIVLTGILFTLLFATCKQFTADIDDYLSRWSSEAFIQSSTIDKKTYNDGSSIPSVASANDVTVTLKIQNPKSFWFVMPPASKPKKIVEFAHFAGPKPEAGTDYELTQPSADTLKLVLYSNSFLKNAEWGEKDISSTITLYANDGRPPFKQTFTIPLKANTPPPKPGYAVAKTTGTTAYYVLCITVPDMDKTAGGGLLHKDLACIEVNGTPYTFSVDEGQHKFTKPESPFFIVQPDPPNPPNIKKLTDPDADNVPTGGWVLFYKTDVEVKDGAAKKDYTIKLIDKKGLASDIVNASTKPNKPETEIVRITEGSKTLGSGSGSSESDPIIIGTSGDKAEIRITSATANTTVHCTRTDTGSSTSAKYDGNPVTVPLPLNGGSEKQYKLEYYTDGTGFAATPVKTIYYKVAKKYTVTFSVTGGNGTIQANTGTPVPSGTVSVLHGGTVTFTGRPATGDWKVAGWTVSPGSFASPPGTSTTATLSNVTAATTVTVKFYQSTLQNSATWKDLARAVKNAPDNAVIFIDGEIKATSGTGNNGEIVINKNLTIKRATGASSAVIDANKDTGSKPKHRIFKVKSGNTLTLENLTLKGGIAEMSDMDGSGGGVYVETSGKLIMTDSSITDCEAIGDTGTQKYGEGGGVYNKGTVKMTGGEIKNNKARNGGGIDNNGTLILTNATLTGNTATFIGGALCMSSDSSGEMTGGKIISNECSGTGGGGVYIHAGTFTLNSGASIESNTAPGYNYGGGAYVGQNGTLIINGGSIKLNKARRGGGVYVSGNSTKRGTLRMIQGDISDNGAGWNGTSYTGKGGGVYNSGAFEMTGGEIKDNKAETGGGVYFSEGTFEMKGSAVVTPSTGSEANSKGKNDVYLESGQAITVDGTLSHAHVARITPQSYTATTVLQAGSGVTLKYEVGKFTVTPDVKEDGIAQTWIIDSAGNLKESNMEVRYDKLESYLSSYAGGGNTINRFKITNVPSNDLQSAGYNRMGRLAQKIHDKNKKVALILPDSIPGLTSMEGGFDGCEYLVSLENIPSGVTNMEGCFKGCTRLTHAPAIPSGPTTMRECFKGCTALRQASNIPSTVRNMNKCFEGCTKLTGAPKIESGVTNMENSFSGCTDLTQGPDIPSTVYNMYQCFQGCTSLQELKLMCNYDDSITYFTEVFYGCSNLNNGGIKVLQNQLQAYQDHAGKMKTTREKFSGS